MACSKKITTGKFGVKIIPRENKNLDYFKLDVAKRKRYNKYLNSGLSLKVFTIIAAPETNKLIKRAGRIWVS